MSKLCCCSIAQSRPTLCDPMPCKASLSFTISWSLLKLMSIESMMPSNHLILYHPLLLLPSIFPSIRVFEGKVQLFLAGVASVTHIPCLHLRNIFDCPCCGHLLPSLKILFHLPDENSILSWGSALPPREEWSLQVRDSFKLVSGPTFKLEKQKKFFGSEEQLLLPPP